MRVMTLAEIGLSPVTAYDSQGAASAELSNGGGESHVHVLRFAPGGAVGPHPTGFAQLLVPIAGAGWVSDHTGARHDLAVGQAAFFGRGELHAKGSERGMTAVMIQVGDLALVTPPAPR